MAELELNPGDRVISEPPGGKRQELLYHGPYLTPKCGRFIDIGNPYQNPGFTPESFAIIQAGIDAGTTRIVRKAQ